MEKFNKMSNATSIQTFDFTTLYTTLDHKLILNSLKKVVNCTLKDKRLRVVGNQCFFTEDEEFGYGSADIMKLIQFVIENIYFRFGDITLKQCIGIPMGTDCAPQLANLMLHSLEHDFICKLMRDRRLDLCRSFRYVFRYIDDITILNGHKALELYYKDIYPDCLSLEKVNTDDKSADVLDLRIDIVNKRFNYKTYDKRRDYNFAITNFPHISSNVPLHMCLNVYKDQIWRHGLLNTSYSDFIYNVQLLIHALLRRGYPMNMLICELKKSIRNNDKIQTRYGTNVRQVIRSMRF
jgi:hypothetical protein